MENEKEKSETKKKVALYSRVSTGHQTNENQTLILKKHAERMGWNYEMFVEQESTRKTRPVKYGLMQKLRNREFDFVCVLKLDRWARSMTELAIEIKELYEKGVPFISIRDNIDLSTASGKLQFNILASFAEFERDLISERTIDGLARAKANGKRLGRPKGAKDTKRRKRSGYHLRHACKKTVEKYQGRIFDENE